MRKKMTIGGWRNEPMERSKAVTASVVAFRSAHFPLAHPRVRLLA